MMYLRMLPVCPTHHWHQALRMRGEAGRDFPPFGSSTTAYEPVVANFYAFWRSFATVLDFAWTDEYNPASAPNRKVRRLIDEENKKTRKKARQEYSEEVRELASFLRKRDKRVMAWQVEQKKKQAEQEEIAKRKKQEAQAAKLARAMEIKEAAWMAGGGEDLDDDDDDDDSDALEEGGPEGRRGGGGQQQESDPLECVICNKRFKSGKQLEQHEKSKKHQQKLKELCELMMREDAEAAEWLQEESGSEGEGEGEDGAEGEGETGSDEGAASAGAHPDQEADCGEGMPAHGRRNAKGAKGKGGEQATGCKGGKGNHRGAVASHALERGRDGLDEVGNDGDVTDDGSNPGEDDDADGGAAGTQHKGRGKGKKSKAKPAGEGSGKASSRAGVKGNVARPGSESNRDGPIGKEKDLGVESESSGKRGGRKKKGKGGRRLGDDDDDDDEEEEPVVGFSPMGVRLAPKDKRKQKKMQQKMRNMAQAAGGNDDDDDDDDDNNEEEVEDKAAAEDGTEEVERRAGKRPVAAKGKGGWVGKGGRGKGEEKEEEEKGEDDADERGGKGKQRNGQGQFAEEEDNEDEEEGEEGDGAGDDDGYFLHRMLHAHKQKSHRGVGKVASSSDDDGNEEEDEEEEEEEDDTGDGDDEKSRGRTAKGTVPATGRRGSAGAGIRVGQAPATRGASGSPPQENEAEPACKDGTRAADTGGDVDGNRDAGEGVAVESSGLDAGNGDADVSRVTEAVAGMSCRDGGDGGEDGAEGDAGGVGEGSSDGDAGGGRDGGSGPAVDAGMTKAQARKAKLAEKRKKKKAEAGGNVAGSASTTSVAGKADMKCSVCGFQASSRTQLFKHIASEGHAALKYR
eukprot:jgi/Mesvir1/12074/Mv00354-RA.2